MLAQSRKAYRQPPLLKGKGGDAPCSPLPASLGPAPIICHVPRGSGPAKGNNIIEEAEQIFGEKVNITTEGKRHLGAVITYRIQRI